jgi:hypothetical protein
MRLALRGKLCREAEEQVHGNYSLDSMGKHQHRELEVADTT